MSHLKLIVRTTLAGALVIGATGVFFTVQHCGLLPPLLTCAVAADERGAHWQRFVEEGGEFRFNEERANILYALSQYGGDCEIHIIYDPQRWSMLEFKFVRNGKEILVLQGHARSVFLTQDNVLYFAPYHPGETGCSVAAYDLTSGRQLWQTRLKGVGNPPHSAYENLVNMGLGGEVISIGGHESYGDYVEILDRKTGKRLAHRIFREENALGTVENKTEEENGPGPILAR